LHSWSIADEKATADAVRVDTWCRSTVASRTRKAPAEKVFNFILFPMKGWLQAICNYSWSGASFSTLWREFTWRLTLAAKFAVGVSRMGF